MPKAFISVGSNMDPSGNVKKALKCLSLETRILKISTVYETEPECRPKQSWYYNCVVKIETKFTPVHLKYEVLRNIEKHLGRRRTKDKFAARPIDLDLIIYGDKRFVTEDLILPDPQILRRAFLAVAIKEMSPGLRLPGTHLKIDDIVSFLPQDNMIPLVAYTKALRKEIKKWNQV